MTSFNPFHSKRLIYRAAEEDDQDAEFANVIFRSVESQVGYDGDLLRPGRDFPPPPHMPPGMRDHGSYAARVNDHSFMGVLICLNDEEAEVFARESPHETKEQGQKSGDDDSGEDTKSETGNKSSDGKPDKPPHPAPIGEMKLHSQADRDAAHHRRATISIILAPEFQGRGYGSEAIDWMLGYGFQMAGLHRIELNAFAYNERAIRAYNRLGLVEEGRRRERMWFNGKFYDEVVFGILEHEWRAKQDGAEAKWGTGERTLVSRPKK